MSGLYYPTVLSRFFFVLGLSGLYSIAPAYTAEPVSFEDYLAMPLEELLNLPITGSTLTEKNLRTVPSSVTVFTHEQIHQLGANYLHELIAYVPGFQAFRQEESSDEYYHSARGHRSSTASREVLILIDGQRFNREFDNASAAPMLSLGNIEKVEFIRGPGSAIYGSNAALGVINITTLKNTNEATVSYGSNEHIEGQGLVNTQLGTANLDVFINAFDDQGESLTLEDAATHSDVTSSDPYQGYDVNVKLGWQRTQLNFMHFERQANDYYVLGDNSNELNETQNSHSSLQFQQSFGNADSFESSYSLRYYENTYFAQLDLVGLPSDVEQTEQNLEFQFHNNWHINSAHSLQFGLEQRHSDIDEAFLNLGGTEFLVYREANRDVTGVYLQDQSHLSDRIELTLGARYDDYSQMGSAISPRFGLTGQLSDVHTLKLLYGEAFRAPTMNELRLEDIPGISNLVGNPDLEPEIIKTWELIWMGNWQSHSLAVTLFDNTIEHAIALDETVAQQAYINASSDESFQGLEIEYMGQMSASWSWRSSYSYMEDLSNEDFSQASELASLILNYQQANWNFNISSSYAGERDTVTPNGIKTLSDYWLMHSKLQYAFNPRQSVYLQAKNLLDEDYQTPFQRFTTFNDGLPNRGRELSVGLIWKF